jgi:hypothetical protein
MNCPVFLTLIRLSRIMCRAFSRSSVRFAYGVLYVGKYSQQPVYNRVAKFNLYEHELEHLPSPLFAKGRLGGIFQRASLLLKI